ncbi:MAG: mycofactocin radical SAM maturase [Acidimicrobiales bacterium]
MAVERGRLADQLALGLDAPICLTWEITYGCNLACTHCLSSSGRRDPRELSTQESMGFIDDLAAMGVFYVNIGGGEPTLRADFTDLVEYAIESKVGVKFSTNGTTLTPARASRLAAMDYLDIQISLDGARPASNDPVRGSGSYEAAVGAMAMLADAGCEKFKVSVVVTRHNAGELDDLLGLAERFGGELRVTRLRPSGRGAATWHELRPTSGQLAEVHRFLVDHPQVLTGDSFFHLAPLGEEPLAGLNLCGAGRVVCLVDPLGDVYACPFVMHPEFRAGSIRDKGGFAQVWREAELFAGLRQPATEGACNACGSFGSCHGGCMAAKFFTGLPLDGPDPECVLGHGEAALLGAGAGGAHKVPEVGSGHSKPPGFERRGVRSPPVPVALGTTRR